MRMCSTARLFTLGASDSAGQSGFQTATNILRNPEPSDGTDAQRCTNCKARSRDLLRKLLFAKNFEYHVHFVGGGVFLPFLRKAEPLETQEQDCNFLTVCSYKFARF